MKLNVESKLFNMGNHKGLKTIALDSALIAGMAGLATLGNTIPTGEEIYLMAKAFGIAFLAQAAFELKIKPALQKK